MKRRFFAGLITISFVAVLLGAVVVRSRATRPSGTGSASSPQSMRVEVTPWGPTQKMIDEASAKLAKSRQVQRYLNGTRNRLISFELIMEDEKASSNPIPPNRYRGTFYDYTNNLTIIAEGSFDKSDKIDAGTSAWQPLPSNEEFDEAVSILKSDKTFGPAMADDNLKPYRPMPPLYIPGKVKGRADRIINVGLRAKDPQAKTLERPHEVVAVNLSHPEVIRFDEGAPPMSKAGPDLSCGPSATGSSTGRGVAGQYQFTITAQDGTELWSFLAIRPSSSSGSNASGIELQNVKYKTRLVLKRAHVPILNVLYDGNTCGPYRDWEYQENQFNADPTFGVNVAPGVRSCTVQPTTELDSGDDSGNFQGIAYYSKDDAIILVSEMAAGWYRYISEWGFHADGTISPRFGMGATSNSCTCNGHVHHAYWRFDFDVDGSSLNRVTETAVTNFSSPQPPTALGTVITSEKKRYRDTKPLSWIIDNMGSGYSYMIRPNSNDGTALNDSYGSGDLWFLNYSATEIDDVGVRTSTAANLDAFINSQKVVGSDVVVWYAIHIPHNRPGGMIMGPPFIAGQLVAGPDLVPVRW